MLCLNKSALQIQPDSVVIPAADYAAVVEARQLLALAEQEAAMIREEAQAEFERQRAAGYHQGLEQAKAEMAEQMVTHMSQSAAYFSKVEGVLIDLVTQCTKQVIGEFESRDLVERIVRKSLEVTRNEGNVTVRVAPAQSDWLKGRCEAILQSFPRIQFLEILPDPRITQGNAVVETEIGVVDATLETQLKAIENALIRSMK